MNSNDFKDRLLPVSPKLYRLCLRFLSNREEAKDAVQEAYLKLWGMRDKLNEINNPEAFATVVAKNLCLDRLKARRLIFMDEMNIRTVNSPDHEKDLLFQTENRESAGIVHEIIGRLPDQQKNVITLRDIEECSFEEIKEITGLSINNIRVSLSRARKQVRDELIKVHEYGTENDKKTS